MISISRECQAGEVRGEESRRMGPNVGSWMMSYFHQVCSLPAPFDYGGRDSLLKGSRIVGPSLAS